MSKKSKRDSKRLAEYFGCRSKEARRIFNQPHVHSVDLREALGNEAAGGGRHLSDGQLREAVAEYVKKHPSGPLALDLRTVPAHLQPGAPGTEALREKPAAEVALRESGADDTEADGGFDDVMKRLSRAFMGDGDEHKDARRAFREGRNG